MILCYCLLLLKSHRYKLRAGWTEDIYSAMEYEKAVRSLVMEDRSLVVGDVLTAVPGVYPGD